jgi:hypothetical protein
MMYFVIGVLAESEDFRPPLRLTGKLTGLRTGNENPTCFLELWLKVGIPVKKEKQTII